MKKELFISADLRTLQNKSTENLLQVSNGTNMPTKITLPNLKTSEKFIAEKSSETFPGVKTSEKIVSEIMPGFKTSEKIFAEKSTEKVIAEITTPSLPSEPLEPLKGIECDTETNTPDTNSDERLF
ncbi:MAG: hypothetical protein LUG16_07395 [Candidatus Gastranaerophilales bacterium]|nr:hypothetical protein [Candidatus Gastranaerophilales bacterium]